MTEAKLQDCEVIIKLYQVNFADKKDYELGSESNNEYLRTK